MNRIVAWLSDLRTRLGTRPLRASKCDAQMLNLTNGKMGCVLRDEHLIR